VTLAASVVVLAGTWLVLRGTPLGKNVRAISNDDVLARVVGINVDGTVLFSAMLGSGLAAVAGVLMSFDTNLIPTMGFQALLLGVVGAVVGGINSFGGAVLGGLLLGITQHLAVWRVPTQWQDAIVFAILVLFLILRPQGFLGKPLGRAAV
jgi:branched-chain amino acid transport system permease protein